LSLSIFDVLKYKRLVKAPIAAENQPQMVNKSSLLINEQIKQVDVNTKPNM
jgi:hypothetical protein